MSTQGDADDRQTDGRRFAEPPAVMRPVFEASASASMPHPLDDDPLDDKPLEFGRHVEGSPVAVYRPLLRASIIAVAISFGLLFASGIAVNLSPPNSSFEYLSSGLNRISAIAMLLSFVGVLVAYRIPHLHKVTLPRSDYGWMRTPITNVIVFNLAVLGLIWAGLMVMAPLLGNVMLPVVAALAVMAAGLLLTIAVWHNDYRRAYAIGVLTAYLFYFQSGAFGWILFYQTPGRFSQYIVIPIGLAATLAILSGMVSALYVLILTYIRQRSPMSPPTSDIPIPDKRADAMS